MKKILAIAVLFTGILLTACDKKDVLPRYNDGTASTLTASTAAVAPAASDSDKVALTLTWSTPGYASDNSKNKYVVEIDSVGKNFSKPLTKTIAGATTASYTAKELNAFLVNRGYAFGKAVTMEARVTSAYSNNNERLVSSSIPITMTPYKVPPKVPLPATGRLFIVGDASTFGWSNDPAPPVFPAAREFARLDETTYGGVFYLNGSGGYKILTEQSVWSSQYHMVSGGTATSGDFEYKDADPTFPSPATAGWYKVMLDFQTGRFSVTPFGYNEMPQQLYVTGDATGSGWTDAPPETQKLNRLNSAEFEISLALVPGKLYKFLSSNGSWQPQFGGSSATGGTLGANFGGGQDPAAIPTPAAAGTYKVRVNFFTGRYTVTQ